MNTNTKNYAMFLCRVVGAGLLLGSLSAAIFLPVLWYRGDAFPVNRAVGVGCLVFCFCSLWSSASWASFQIAALNAKRAGMSTWAFCSAMAAGFAEWVFAAAVPFVTFLAVTIGPVSLLDADSSGYGAFEGLGYSDRFFLWGVLPIGGSLVSLVGARIVRLIVWALVYGLGAATRALWSTLRWALSALTARREDVNPAPGTAN